MAQRVRITDVSPRDGLQNEAGVIATPDKARLVRLLCEAGVDEVEVSSFVSARWVPQLGDAAEVFSLLHDAKPKGTLFSALVPNETGLEAALAVNQAAGTRLIDRVAVFTAASETFSKKNTNATIAETLKRFDPVIKRAKAAGLGVRGYVSCVAGCPFEGEIAPEKVSLVAQGLWDLGADEIDLGDTIGAAEPADIALLINAMTTRLGDRVLEQLTLHLHDTSGHAAESVGEALALGVRSFDASVGGLGGCPYASTSERRAPGNLSTQALVRTVAQAGFVTGVVPERLDAAAGFARDIVARARAGAHPQA